MNPPNLDSTSGHFSSLSAVFTGQCRLIWTAVYSDNDYSSHDNGIDDQCKTVVSKGFDGGPAYVTITIFRGIPCSQRADIGLKMAQLILEKAAISAGAGALVGAMSVPTPATALAGALSGGIIGFNTAGFSAAVYYQLEYQIDCVLKWGNSHLLMASPLLESALGVSSGRP